MFVLNGLDIPVSVTIEAEGNTQTFEVAPKGRATPDVSGKANVKVTSTKGELTSEGPAVFGKAGSEGCFYVYNVVGAAAYVNEDVAYGTGFGGPSKHRRAGSISESECGINYPFVEPPESIKVKQAGQRPVRGRTRSRFVSVEWPTLLREISARLFEITQDDEAAGSDILDDVPNTFLDFMSRGLTRE